MKYVIKLPGESTKLLREMADTAGITISDLIEISVYNLIALYVKDKAEKSGYEDAQLVVESVDPGPIPESGGKPYTGVVGV